MSTIFKKGRDLKPGDVIKGDGIILEIDLKSEFFGDKPCYSHFDVNDSYHGPYSRQFEMGDDFEIFTDRMNINRYFKTIKCDISNYIADTLNYRNKLQSLHDKKIKQLNKQEKLKSGKKKI